MPGIKCGGCSKFMSPADGVKCVNCSMPYHRVCAALPQTGNISPPWRCFECKKKTVKVNAPTAANPSCTISPVVSETVTDFETELRLIRDELRTMRNEFRAFREDMAEIRALHGRFETIEKRLSDLEQSSLNYVTPNLLVDEAITRFKREANDRDQELLANDLEISNIPECSGENLKHNIKLVATKLGVSLDDRDIVSVDRAGSRLINATDSSGPTEPRPRPIVVRLARRDLRDDILKSARVRRGATTSDLGLTGKSRRFYVNERLTKSNRMLFRQARNAGQQYGWKFVWTSRGRILARRGPGDIVRRISSEADISKVFGGAVQDISGTPNL